MRRYAFVTIAFEGDHDLMLLQAKSMALHCARELVAEIIVVDNFAGGAPPAWVQMLLESYGRLAPLVRIIAAGDVTPHPGNVDGWWHQQALKLAVADKVTADRYVVLDAKTHLIAPLLLSFLETADGRARINRYGLDKHPLRPKLEKVCEYVGIDAQESLEHGLVRTSTPFTMFTAVASSVATHIGRREGVCLSEAMARQGITEFFTYGAMLKASGALHELYDFAQPWCQAIWVWVAKDPVELTAALARAHLDTSGPFFSAHRGALPLLTDGSRRELALFWVEAGLFHDVEDAELFMLDAGEHRAG